LASLILKHNKYVEKLRFVSSGTEAVMSALRLARGYTGKTKIVKFDGCYHGHVDSLLVNAGSGLVTFGQSSSAGIPDSFVRETIVLPLNNVGALQELFYKYPSELAAVIIEPIPANNGLLLQTPEFLAQLRELCTKNKTLLIFDEVISGFRVGFDGAAGYYDIQPDLITYGKIIGGGMPVGCYGGKAEIMSRISPEGDVYQAGTLSGNPMAMAAGIATLKELLNYGFYKNLSVKTKEFAEAINRYAESQNYEFSVSQIGSIFWFKFTKAEIRASADINPDSMKKFRVFHKMLLEKGIYLGPSGYEVGFISAQHSKNDLEIAKRVIFNALDKIFKP
jgi:glutamate-1-semialdehyde 2,1-aminomutase